MFRFSIGEVNDTQIDIHISWLLVLVLTVWGKAVYFPEAFPGLNQGIYWGLGIAAGILALLSVLWHEVGHLWAARRDEIRVNAVTLFVSGGVHQLNKPLHEPWRAIRFALAGPLFSLALAALFVGLWWLKAAWPWLAAVSGILAIFNLGLALFNLLPAYPLDGAWLWPALALQLGRRVGLAPRDLAFAGEITGIGLIGLGSVTLFVGELLIALGLGLVGWILQHVNLGSYRPWQDAPTSVSDLRTPSSVQSAEASPFAAPEEGESRTASHSLTALQEALHETEAEKVLLVEDGRPVRLLSREEVLGYAEAVMPENGRENLESER
jgi:Zn-dependent protease